MLLSNQKKIVNNVDMVPEISPKLRFTNKGKTLRHCDVNDNKKIEQAMTMRETLVYWCGENDAGARKSVEGQREKSCNKFSIIPPPHM